MTTYYLKTGGRCTTQLAKMTSNPKFVKPAANGVVRFFFFKYVLGATKSFRHEACFFDVASGGRSFQLSYTR